MHRYKEEFKPILDKIVPILESNLEALNFIYAYSEYVELIDDCVDEPKDIERIDKMTQYASLLYTSNYWKINGHMLFLVEQVIHIMYFNSTKWENAVEPWKQRDAKVLSHCGYMMLFAVLLLETKDQALVQSLSIEFMEYSHKAHLHDMSKEVLMA